MSNGNTAVLSKALPTRKEKAQAITTKDVARAIVGNADATQLDVMEEIKRLRAENEELKKAKEKRPRGYSLKVSEKGCVSFCGIRRFPVTFYAGEWETMLDHADQIRAFIKEHDAQLSRK